jgi:hypothetical protein
MADLHLTIVAEPLDIILIWGGPIFSVSGVDDDGGVDKLCEADELSTAIPLLPDAIDLNPMIFATPHNCARDPGSRIVCNLPIPSGTIDNT